MAIETNLETGTADSSRYQYNISMTDTTSMSARDSIAGSASLFAELLDGRQEEAVPPPSDTIDNLTTIVNDEVADQFDQVKKASVDRLGLDKEKQLTDYNMLGSKLPDGLKMALTTCLLKTHEINALAKDPTTHD